MSSREEPRTYLEWRLGIIQGQICTEDPTIQVAIMDQ